MLLNKETKPILYYYNYSFIIIIIYTFESFSHQC